MGKISLQRIVKKNAMMIDFALEAERVEHKSPEEAIFQDGRGTVPAARHHPCGRFDFQPNAHALTTPVICLWFDRLAQRFAKHEIGNPIPQEIPAD
jgi:hypothetical protein